MASVVDAWSASASDLERRVALSSIVSAEGVSLKRAGREWKGLCPFHRERTPSYTINDFKRFGHCFGCGAHHGAVGFVMQIRNLPFRDAVRHLAGLLGAELPDGTRPARPAGPPPRLLGPPPVDDGDDDGVEAARVLWRTARPGLGTLIEATLEARGIDLDALVAVCGARVPPTLRFLPALPYWNDGRCLGRWPAMLAPIQDGRGRVIGVHRTYLDPRGGPKAEILDDETGELCPRKKVLGEAWGGCIRLAPAGARLGLAEGIENALAVMCSTPEGEVLPAWTGVSLGNVAGPGKGFGRPHPTKRHIHGPQARKPVLVPTDRPDLARDGLRFPPVVRSLVLLEDADGDRAIGRALWTRAWRRYTAMGLHVTRATPPEGMDFCDMLAGAA